MFDSFEQSIEQIHAALDEGRTSSVQLVDDYLARIAACDKAGPAINAMISLHPDAHAQAARRDDERAQGGARGVLHGIPMVVKDNIDVAGLPTTAGSVVLRAHTPARDAEVVARLKQAGAIVLGKTNMSEFACSNGRYGYSSLGGLTLNPYNRKRNAAGSSSGSGAAVAANFAAYALGTDTFGSVRAPACVAGLVGIRPTLGLIPGEGVLPLALSFDVTGPMARSVRDAALVLQAMATPMAGTAAADYLGGLHRDALRGARLGVAMDFPAGNSEVRDIMHLALRRLAESGAAVLPMLLPEPATTVQAKLLGPLADAELMRQLGDYLRRNPGPWASDLAQVVQAASEPAVTASARPVNPRTVESLRRSLSLARTQGADQRAALLADLADFRKALDASMRGHALDAIVFPTLSCPASPRYDQPDPTYTCTHSNPYAGLYIASAAGLPEVTVPAGVARSGVPVGMSFMGLAGGEGRLLALAYAFEQATQARVAPELPDTPDMSDSPAARLP